MPTGLRAFDSFEAGEEVSKQRGRFEGAPRLGRHQKKGAREIDALLGGTDRVGVRRVEKRQLRIARSGAKCLAEHLRAEAATTHAEQGDVGEARGADFFCER